jgi:Asp-tRNA(Asn)/Glu-tRNA(Gln) amidotransferase C subunit
MLATLQSQLHFVREIQAVDTTGVEPLQALRDETEEGIKEITVGLEELKEALSKEDVVGRMRRPRRRRGDVVDTDGAEEWDVLGPAKRKVGKYFVVDSSTGTDTQGTVDDITSSKTDAA